MCDIGNLTVLLSQIPWEQISRSIRQEFGRPLARNASVTAATAALPRGMVTPLIQKGSERGQYLVAQSGTVARLQTPSLRHIIVSRSPMEDTDVKIGEADPHYLIVRRP
jgi:hypothetical protein